MKPHFFLCDETDGNGDAGGGTLLSGSTPPADPPTTSTPPADDGNAGTPSGDFDFRKVVGDDGKFSDGWTENLPEDLKPYAATLGKYPNATELLRGLGNASKLIGQKTQGVQVPGPDAKPEEIAEFHKALGVPESPEGYNLTKPEKLPDGVEWNEDEIKGFAEFAHKQGLLPDQTKALIEFDMQRQQSLVGKASANVEEFVAKQREDLKTEWGEEFDGNIDRAKAAASALGLDPNDAEIGNSAKMIKALHRASLLMKEDQIATGNKVGYGQSNEAKMEEIRRSPEYMGEKGQTLQQAAAAQLAALAGVKV